MAPDGSLTLFHAPRSRSTGVVVLLEELGVPYRLRVLDPDSPTDAALAYRSIEPLGQVPALLHQGQLVSGPVAVAMYLADLHASRALAPMPLEPLRGPYLRWMSWLDGAYGLGASVATSGRRGDLMSALDEALCRGPYLLGERYSAADVLWACALDQAGLEGSDLVQAYVSRVLARPAAQRVRDRDAVWAAELTAGRTVEAA